MAVPVEDQTNPEDNELSSRQHWHPIKDLNLRTVDGLLAHRRTMAINAQFSGEPWQNRRIWEYIKHLEEVLGYTYREGLLRTQEGLPIWRKMTRENELPYNP